jgi:hypothetical protein
MRKICLNTSQPITAKNHEPVSAVRMPTTTAQYSAVFMPLLYSVCAAQG